jgi:hypothetical protein
MRNLYVSLMRSLFERNLFGKAFGRVAVLTPIKLFLPVALTFLSLESAAQCTTVGSEPSMNVTLAPTCTNQTTSGTNGIGKGSQERYLGFTASQWYTLSLSDGGGTSCRQAIWQNSSNVNIGGWFSIASAVSVQAPAGASRLLVTTTRNNTTWSTTSSHLTYRKTTPTLAANSPASATICTGGSVTISPGAASNGTAHWQNTTSNGASSGGAQTAQTVSPTGSVTTYYFRPFNNGECPGTQQSTTVTVVADPTATATRNPNVATVCANGTVSLTSPSRSGGTGTCSFQYRFWNGSTWSGWSGTSSYTAVAGGNGTNRIQIRSNCNGSGCDVPSTGTEYSWNVVAQPTPPTSATKSPNVASVCRGTVVSVSSPSGGTNGVGCNTFEYLFQRGSTTVQGWGSATSYTTVAADEGNTINVRVRRTGCSGSTGCIASAQSNVLASWSVVPQPAPPTGGITKSPNVAEVCVGQALSVTGTPSGGNPGIGCGFQYRFLRGATEVQGWSASTTYTTVAADAGNGINVQVRRANCQSGCNTSGQSANLVSWTVRAQPTISIAVTSSPICNGTNQAVLTQTINTSGGCSTAWQQAASASGPWSAASGSVSGNNFTTSALTATTYYRAVRTCTATNCSDPVSNVVSVALPDGPEPAGTFPVVGCGAATVSVVVGAGNEARFYTQLTAGVPSGSFTSGTSITTTSNINYYVTEFDPLTGCESGAFSTFNVTVNPAFTVSLSNPNNSAYGGFGVQCFGSATGAITATVSSTSFPITYAWSDGTTNVVSSSTNTVTGLLSGDYGVVVTDAAGCVNSEVFSLSEPPVISVSNTYSNNNGFNVSCNGGNNGSINTSVSGGRPGYTYAWTSTPAGFTSSAQNISGLTARTYNLTVTDANGCTNVSSHILDQPDPLTLTHSIGYVCSGSSYTSAIITIVGAGGTGSYEFSRNGGSTWQVSNTFSGLANGSTHQLRVRDSNGCQSAVQNVTITFPTPGTAVGDCDFIYVSTAGDPTTTLGTKTCTATLLQAFTIYAGNPARNRVLVQEGTYAFAQTINIPAGVTIEGGFTVNAQGDWVKSNNTETVFNINPPLVTPTVSGVTVGHHIGVNASVSNFTMRDLTLNVQMSGAQAGTTSGRGRSIYGIYMDGASNYTIERCKVNTGAANNGLAGANGANGVNGGNAPGPGVLWGPGPGANGCGGWLGYPGDGGIGGGGTQEGWGTWDACGTAPVLAAANGTGRNGGGGGAGGSGRRNNGGRSGDNGGTGGGPNGAGATGGGAAGQKTSRCCNTNGSPGNNGSNGGNGTNGSTTASIFNNFFLPGFGTDGTNGGGGGGGKGGGGGAGQQDYFFFADCGGPGCVEGTGAGGGGGGGGGQGGELATGGRGGGSSFAIYRNASGVGAIIANNQLNPGAAGQGGAGGTGGTGGSGGQGSNGGGGSDGESSGGRGGNGGAGGKGGDGGNGPNGVSVQLYTVGSGATSPSITLPTLAVSANVSRGCTNSQIELTKNSGTWTLVSGAQFVNNLTSSTTSYTTSGANSNPVSVFYTTTGGKNLQVGSNVYHNFITILQNRALGLPTINTINDVCPQSPINLGTSLAGAEEYRWEITTVGNPTANVLAPLSGQNPGTVNPPSGGWIPGTTYQVRLSVREECCGWSIPVYETFNVIGQPDPAGPISGTNPLCANTTGVTYSIASVPGANQYDWSVGAGATLVSGQGGTSIVVNFGSGVPTVNISVTPRNTLCTPNLNGTPSSITVTVNANPVPTVSGTLSICSGTSTTLTGGVSAGPGGVAPLSYSWSGGPISGSSDSQVMNTTNLNANTNYTLNVQNGNSCVGSTQVTVNVSAPPIAPTGISGTTTICNGGSTTLTATGGSEGDGATYQWYAGGCGSGGALGTGVSITVSPTANTTYFVRRVGTAPCSNVTACASVTVNVSTPPTAPTAITGTTTICANTSTTLTASGGTEGSGATYQWGTGATVGSNIISGATSVSYTTPTLSANTTYWVRRVGAAPCTSTITGGTTQLVTVQQAPTAPTAITGTTTICNGGNTTLTATGGSNGAGAVFQWGTGSSVGSNILVGETTSSITVSPSSNTTYWVRRVGNTSCTNTTGGVTQLVTVNDVPSQPSVITGNDAICAATSQTYDVTNVAGVTYTWSYSGTTSVAPSGSSNSVTFTPTGSGTLTVTPTNSCGNGTARTLAITVNTVPNQPSVITGPPAVCANATNTFSVTNVPGVTYAWTYSGSGFLTPTGNSTTLQATTGGTLTITPSNGCGSGTARTLAITIAPNPTATIAGTTTICSGSSTVLTATPSGGQAPYTHSWAGGPIASGSGSAAMTTSNLTSTQAYTYTVTDNLGCFSSVGQTVTVDPASVGGTASSNHSICSGSQPNNITLSGHTGSIQWQESADNSFWSDISGETAATLTGAAIGNLTATRYYRAQVTSGVCAAVFSNTVTVTVRPEPAVTISGTATVCQFDDPAPQITFINAGTLPILVTYNVNSGGSQFVAVGASTSATVAAPTGSVGTFTYNLVSVSYQNNPTCSAAASGSAVITVNESAVIGSVTGASPMCIGDLETYTANGVSLGGGTGSWSSSDVAVAAVNASTGVVTAVFDGTADIIYTITGGCGGDVTEQQEVVVHPNATVGTVSGTSPLCVGGAATYSVTGVNLGGTGTGAWSASNGNATVDIIGEVAAVSAGLVNIVYTVTGGCGGTQSAQQALTVDNTTTTAPTAINASPGATICNAGTVTLTATGGTVGSSVYEWGTGSVGDNIIPGEDGDQIIVSGLSADTQFWVRRVGTADCPVTTAAATITINLDQTISITDEGGVHCTDPAGTTLTATYSGGTGCSLQWQINTTDPNNAGAWSNIGGATADNLPTGALGGVRWFRAVRTCSGGCPAAVSGVTEVYPIAVPTIASSTILGCGAATIAPEIGLGGNTMNFYGPNSTIDLLSTGTSYQTFAVGGPDSYYVTSFNTDNGCESGQLTVSVEVTAAYTMSLTAVDYSGFGVSCAFGNDGEVTATAGGTAVFPITYAWSNFVTNTVSASTNTISSLLAGQYVVVTTDAANCFATDTISLDAPDQLTVALNPSNFSGWNLSCNGSNTGLITAVPSGGAGGYTYNWTSTPAGYTASTAVADELVARTYNLIVADANGCTVSGSRVISQPAPITFSTFTGYVCSGSTYTAANVTAIPSGGASATYEYRRTAVGPGAWQGWQASNVFTALAPGDYNIEVRDLANPTCVSTVQSITITLPPDGTVIDACNFIYVSEDGDPAGTLGQKDCPVTLPQALVIYGLDPTRNHVLVKEGNYTYNQKLTLPGGITIDGGYTVSGVDWVKSSSATSAITLSPSLETATVASITVGHYIGIEMGGNNISLRDLSINVNPDLGSGVTNGRGRSIYGVYIAGQTGINISRCVVETAAAASGPNGETVSPAIGGGGAGGTGGTIVPTPSAALGCPVTSVAGVAGSAGGAGSSGGGTGGVGGSSCVKSSPGCVGCNGGNGGNGSAGVAGDGFTPGDAPVAALGLDQFFVPQSGANGGAGSGGGGGGRGGDGAGGLCPNVDVLPGQPGGAGGAGGAGGNGGGGGGASIAVYAFGGSGNIIDCVLNAGAAGAGGTGSTGAVGESGQLGSGYVSPTGCDGLGGAGGDGGNGGAGGRGQDGANGISQTVMLLNGASFSQSGFTIPDEGITANWYRGCRNSEIILSRTSAANWSGIGSDPAFVNNLTETTTDYVVGDNTVSIYYPSSSSLGAKNISVVGATHNRFIQLYDDRIVTVLPTTINEIDEVCATGSIELGTNLTAGQIADILQWDWTVSTVNDPTTIVSGPFVSAAPGVIPAPSGGWQIGETYQVKLRVYETCCGWSIPVYRTFTVAPQLPAASPITASNTGVVCAGEQVTYSVPLVAGATDYNWTVNGGTLQSGQGTQSITVLWSSATTTGSVAVYPSNSCPDSDGPLTTLNQSVNGLPSSVTIIGQSGNPLTFCHPGSVTLQVNATSGGGVGTGVFTYLWTPGATTGQTVAVNPASPGSFPYDVTVTEGGSGCTGTASATVNADQPAVVVAGGDLDVCESPTPGAITLSGASFSGSAAEATWSTGSPGTFGNLGDGTNPQAVTFTPQANWSGAVTLTLTSDDPSGACGPATDTRTLTVHPAPTLVLTSALATQVQEVCDGQPIVNVTYTASGATGIDVSNLPAGLNASVLYPTVTISGTPTAGGTYTLTTTGGHSSCAAATIQGTITVNPLPVATITPSGPTELCDGEDVTLTASAGASYLWTPGSTTLQDLVVSATGSYTVTVTDANSCSATSAATVVNVYTAPTITLTSGLADQTVCDGVAIGAIEFTLGGSASNVSVSGLPSGLNDNFVGGVLTITGTPAAGGTYSISTTGQNAACAPATIGGTITVNVPAQATISAGGPTDFCEGGSVQLTASAGSSYLWSPGAATTQDITVNSTGNYTVTVTDGNGCQSTSLVTSVVEHPAPTVVFATGDLNQTLCAGNALVTTTFTLGGGATGADVTNLPAGLTASVSFGTVTISGNPTASGTYTVTTTGQNASCTAATIDGAVTVNQLPVVTISAGGPIEFCQGGSVVLSSSEAVGNAWSTTEATQDITVNTSGSYTVSVTDGNGCTGTSAATVVTVYAQPTLALAGASYPASQSVCPGASISAISYDFGGSATGVNVTGLPTGVSANVSGSSVTITGTPDFTATYTVSTTGQDPSCAAAELTGTLTVYPAPVASISAGGPVDFCAGGSVTLTASGGTSYVWSTTEITPSINVNSSGSFTVTATDVNGCVATSAATVVTVYQAPTITYASGPLTQDLCAGQAITDVTFTLGGSATGVNATGLPSGVSANVSGSTVTVSGTSSSDGVFNYTLSTTGQNALCAAADVSGTIELYALPAAPIITAGGPTTFCDGGSVQLTSSAASGNTWSTTETTQSITVTVDGSYTVTVTDGNGCQAISSSQTVTVNPLPIATIDYTGSPFCPVGTGLVTLTGETGGSYSSTAGLDINTTSGAIDLETSTPDTYTVTYSFSDVNGCANSTTAQVIIVPLPTASISYAGTPYCATGVASVTQNGAGGGTYSGSSGLVIDVNTGEIDLGASTPGNHTVTYTFDNQGSSPPAICSNTTTTSVVINALPNVQAGADVAICIGQSVQLNATGASSYAWSPSANLDNNAIADPTFNGSATTVLTVVGTDANSCQNSDNVTVTVNALPSVSVTPAGSTTFCDGGSVNLDAGAGWSSHVWNEGGTPITPAETAQIFVADASGSYTVTVTDANGCSATSAAVAVTVNPLPTATINPAPTAAFCGDGVDDVELTASGGGTYQWQLNTLNLTGETATTLTVMTAGDYTVVVTDANGCSATSAITEVSENEPSAITLTSGSASPAVCDGVAINPIVFTFSGSADNAGVTGLPAGLTASVDVIAKTVTITGTPTAGGTYTVTTSGHVAPCDAATVSGTVTVNTASIVDAGGTQDVCQSSSPSAITLTGATVGGGAATGTWSIQTGSGTLSSTGAEANPATVTFTPDVDFAGTVELVLTTDAAAGCTVETDVRTIEVRELPTLVMAGDETFCYSIQPLSGLLENGAVFGGTATGGTWSLVQSTPAGGYILYSGITTQPDTVTAGIPGMFIGSVTFGFITNDPFGCGAASGDFTATFQGPQPSTTWTGEYNDDWFDLRNWTNCVPGLITAAIIPQLANPLDTPYPRIYGFNASCYTLEIQGTAEVEITGNWQLEVAQ